MIIPQNLLDKYNMNGLEEITDGMSENDKTIVICEEWLSQTDHIPNKIIEELIEDLASATIVDFIKVFIAFIQKVRGQYQEILTLRKQAREELAQAKTNKENEVLSEPIEEPVQDSGSESTGL